MWMLALAHRAGHDTLPIVAIDVAALLENLNDEDGSDGDEVVATRRAVVLRNAAPLQRTLVTTTRNAGHISVLRAWWHSSQLRSREGAGECTMAQASTAAAPGESPLRGFAHSAPQPGGTHPRCPR